MKKPQWISLFVAVAVIALLALFGRTTPKQHVHSPGDGHDHSGEMASAALSTDSVLSIAKKSLNAQQSQSLAKIEQMVSRGDVNSQKMNQLQQLAHFWGDSIGMFPPYAYYEAELAKLENSEKSLNFAAHLLLNRLLLEQNSSLKLWEAQQAEDLFNRSLAINPANDSAKIGLHAARLFSGSGAPMEAVAAIKAIADRDSSFTYGQLVLVKASLLSGQVEKAEERLLSIHRQNPSDIETVLLLADLGEKKGDKAMALKWYSTSLKLIKRTDIKAEIEKRMEDIGTK